MVEQALINQIEEYAGLFMTIEEIAILLNLDEKKFRREVRMKSSACGLAYHRGRLQSIVEIRKQTVLFAKKGSPQSEALVNGYIETQKENEQKT